MTISRLTKRLFPILALGGVAAVGIQVTACVAPPPPDTTTTTSTTVPVGGLTNPDHVVVVVEENHSESSIIGSPSAPYINSLATGGALFTQSFGTHHPSQPNYLALFSGTNQGVTDDACPPGGSPYSTDNLGAQLIAASKTFVGYSETLPAAGSTACSNGGSDGYQRKHNPWVDFSNVPAESNQPFSAFPTDYSTLPAVSFVVPNQIDDMHNGTIAQGDTWLQNNIDGYAQWAKTHNSLLIVTFDEDDYSSSNQIATIFYGEKVSAGTYTETINHYSILRTIEDMYGLPSVANSTAATAITDCWLP